MTPRTVEAIDWSSWSATDRATLCFVVSAGRVLLIRKKRGLGAGKINGPGGRIEDGESPLECAIRETEEELRIRPFALCQAGRLRFQFVDGYGIDVSVFRAAGSVGEARETDEAVPMWTPLDAIPYDEMWEDDRIWLPRMLAGEPFHGRFIFDGDRILDYRMGGTDGTGGTGEIPLGVGSRRHPPSSPRIASSTATSRSSSLRRSSS